MEVAHCVQKAGSNAASLLASLNLQRERAQFCDCVVRQRQNPGRLYPAHRCVLAASSPVFASILSSTGALVELQSPCLSDPVLALLLEYIYTGALPYTRSQQQYCNLFTAACYLQMDELQETLRTEVNPTDHTNASTGAENQPYKDTDSTYSKTVNTFSNYLPLSDTSSVNSLEREDQYCDEIDTCRLWLTGSRKAKEAQTNRKEEDKILFKVSPSQCSSSSLSSPHPCCEAVPVIRHSSTAAMAEVSTMPPYNPVSQASVGSRRASNSRLASTDSERIVEGIATEHENHFLDYRNNKDQIGTQTWGNEDSSDQCEIQDICYKSNADQSDIQKQDYNSSNADHDEHMSNGFTHVTDDNDQHAHCDSFQNHTKRLWDNSVPQHRDCSRESKYESDDFPFKHQRLDCSDCHNVSMASAAEELSSPSQDLRAVVPPPVQDSDTGSDSHCEDLCPEGEAKQEDSCSSRCPAEMDEQDSHCSPYGPKNDWYTNLHRAATSTEDAVSSQHEHDDKDTTMDTLTDRTSLEHENILGTEILEPHLPFTMPMDNNMSDPMYNVVGQSYHGHLRYHCLPQEDTHRDSDHKHPSHPDHSDQSSDEEEVGTFASPGLSPLRQHFATTDQVLLLDISTKPAELLVSYRQRSDEQEKWAAFGQRNTFGYGFADREQRNEATSIAGADKRKIRARIKFRAERFDEAETKAWVGETNAEDSVGNAQEVIHKSGIVEGDNKAAALTVCSLPSVPDSVQAPVSSSLSVCIPSTLSASMPTNVSAHLSTPVDHPFQCSLCERSFSQRGSLNRHVRSHLGVRPFPCPRCPMTFSRQYRVSEHMRVHQRCLLGNEVQNPPGSST